MGRLAAGTEIGRYSLRRRIGAGAMGEVWAAELRGPGGFRKPVALKVLPAGPVDAAQREALLREARLGALLQHPNVVAVHALEEHEGSWVVVMELVRGVSVRQLLGRGPLSGTAILDVGVQVCAGLAHIHALRLGGGLVHRDIKPSNLLVDRSGTVKIADLGVATTVAAGDAVMGTPGYIAPEQLASRPEARSDVFGLAATLYACVARRSPFGKGRAALSALDALDRRLAAPELWAPVDAAVDGLGGVLRRCLQRDPAGRPSAAELGEILAGLRRHHAVGASLVQILVGALPDVEAPTDPSSSGASTVVLGRGNLPAPRGAFFGRDAEVGDLADRVRAGERLVTVLGPGGMGKTRLALEAAQRLRQELAGGAWFLDLSEAVTAEGVCQAVARGLDLRIDGSDAAAEIGWALRGRGNALFVLDNLEQCVEPARDTVFRWLEAAPEARFVATSRIALRLRTERTLILAPLSVEQGAALFVDRAPVVVPEAHLEDARQLVQALEGMPLAIELAAARAWLVPVPVLRQRVGLRLLAGGGPDRPARHRSLEASLQVSWELLEPHRRDALAQLSVFEGGFDLSAAEAVLELPPEAGWALDALQELVDASLVRVDSNAGRFSLLVVVREFAAARLRCRADVEARHGAWYAQLRRSAPNEEIDNLVAACERAIARRDGAIATDCALGACEILDRCGPNEPAVGLLRAALEVAPDERRGELTSMLVEVLMDLGRTQEATAQAEALLPVARARGERATEANVLRNLGSLYRRVGRVDDALACFEASLEHLCALGDRRGEGLARGQLALFLRIAGRAEEALEHCERSLACHRAAGDLRLEGHALGSLGNIHRSIGDLDRARAYYEGAMVIAREVGDRRSEGMVANNLGLVAQALGRIDEARALYEAALDVAREVGARRSEAVALANLGTVHFDGGRPDEAVVAYEAALALHRESGNVGGEIAALANLADLARRRGRRDEARAHLDVALPLARRTAHRRLEGHLLGELAVMLGGAEGLRLVADGLALLEGAGDVEVLAHLHLVRAEILAGTGDQDSAIEALETARSLAPANPTLWAELERVARELVRAPARPGPGPAGP